MTNMNQALPELSTVAIAAFKKIYHARGAGLSVATTAAAGATKEHRKGVAELRKAGVIFTYTNAWLRVNRPGCMAFKIRTGYQKACAELCGGWVSDSYFLTMWGTPIDSRW